MFITCIPELSDRYAYVTYAYEFRPKTEISTSLANPGVSTLLTLLGLTGLVISIT